LYQDSQLSLAVVDCLQQILDLHDPVVSRAGSRNFGSKDHNHNHTHLIMMKTNAWQIFMHSQFKHPLPFRAMIQKTSVHHL
jgi:hypothetical protein